VPTTLLSRNGPREEKLSSSNSTQSLRLSEVCTGLLMLSLEPFYLRSKLPMQRVAECVGANNIVLKKWYKNRKA
jgi:hypothetical protein